MQIIATRSTFNPIKLEITVQSQAEVSALYQLGNYNQRVAEHVAGQCPIEEDVLRELLVQLYSALKEHK